MNKLFKSSLFAALALALCTAALPVLAYGGSVGAGYSAGNWAGSANAGSSSVSSGGSQTETGAQGPNGYASASNQNAGGGTSYAGASVNSQQVTTWTGVSSFSNGESFSHGRENYTTSAAGGNGTDVNSWSNGTFATGGFGGYAGFNWRVGR